MFLPKKAGMFPVFLFEGNEVTKFLITVFLGLTATSYVFADDAALPCFHKSNLFAFEDPLAIGPANIGYRNATGETIISGRYSVAQDFNQFGYAYADGNYINENAEILLRPYNYDNGPDYFVEGLSRYVEKDLVGFVNQRLEKIIPARFDFAFAFSNGRATVCNGCKHVSDGEHTVVTGGKWGAIDRNGTLGVKLVYNDADEVLTAKDFVSASQGALWMQVAGAGEPAVVFISGNGNDSSVWSDIASKIGSRGVRTIVYDRAGLGRSALQPGPYQIKNESDALIQALENKGVDGPLLFVAHSYGGLIALLAAEGNPAVKGVVLVDALLPEDLNETVVKGVLAEYTPRFKAWKEAAPTLAKVIIPIVEAYPETAILMRTVAVRPDLPFIDIVAETSWLTDSQQIAHVRQVHADFVAGSPQRTSVFAGGSSHNVMRDRPEVIVQSIKVMLDHLEQYGAGYQ